MSNQPAPLPASTPAAEGVIGKDEQDRITVTFTRTYPHPVEQVWRAITDPEQSRHWLGKLEFDPLKEEFINDAEANSLRRRSARNWHT